MGSHDPSALPGAYPPQRGMSASTSDPSSAASTPSPIIESPKPTKLNFDIREEDESLPMPPLRASTTSRGGDPPPCSGLRTKHVRNCSLPTPSSRHVGNDYPLCGSNFLQHLRGHSRAHYTSFPFAPTPTPPRTNTPGADGDGEAAPAPRYWSSVDGGSDIRNRYANARPQPRPRIQDPAQHHPPPVFTNPFAAADHTADRPCERRARPTAAFGSPTRDRSASVASLNVRQQEVTRRRSTSLLCRMPYMPHEPEYAPHDEGKYTIQEDEHEPRSEGGEYIIHEHEHEHEPRGEGAYIIPDGGPDEPPSPATTIATMASTCDSDAPSRRPSLVWSQFVSPCMGGAEPSPTHPTLDELAAHHQLRLRPPPAISRVSESDVIRTDPARLADEPSASPSTSSSPSSPSASPTSKPRIISSASSGEVLTRRVSGHLKNLAEQKAASWNEFAYAYAQGWFDPLCTPLFPSAGPECTLPAAAPSTPSLPPADNKHAIIPRPRTAPPSPARARRELPTEEGEDDELKQKQKQKEHGEQATPDGVELLQKKILELKTSPQFPSTEPPPPVRPPPPKRQQTHSRSCSDFGPPPATRRMIEDSSEYHNIAHLSEIRPFYETFGFLPAPLPPQEPERLKALYSFNILYTSNDLNFDRVVHMIKLVFNSRMAFLSLLDGEANWYKSYSGLGYHVSHLRRSIGFCAHVVLTNSEEPFVVLDTHKDWRFRNNPIVTGPTRVRFYAGAPLRTSDGYNIGVLCVVDDKPRQAFSPRSRHILKEFAAIVMRELELWRDRLQLRMRDRIQKSLEEFTRECLEHSDDDVAGHADVDGHLAHVYERAAQVIKETLDLDGCTILDISQFERVEVRNPDGGSPSIIYSANPYTGTGQHSFTSELNTEFGRVAALPILSTTAADVRTHPLTPHEHQLLSQFLGEHRDGRIFNVPPTWIRSVFPASIKYAMVVPIAGIDQQPFALICAHTHDKGKQFLEGFELQFLRGIGAIILGAVLRRRTVLADRSKNVLISSVSHELRTPLHGMLAAGELLGDTPLDTNQEAFLATLRTCGLQLIETVNHVLDFAKLSIEGRDRSTSIQFRRVNIAELIHATVEGCWLGQRARSMQMSEEGDNDIGSFYAPEPKDLIPCHQRLHIHQHLANVESVLDIGFRERGWNVICETGGLRRIIMNLYNNSLKFTESGYVQIMLRELPHPEGQKRIPVELRVIDTGKGISKSFLKNQLFQPFAQENPLQPGTGLGLAIVANIVTSDAMAGNLKVYSAENVGTEIRIQFEVETVDEDENGEPIPPIDTTMGQGFRIAFVNYSSGHRGHQLQQEVMTHYANCLGFGTTDDVADADIVVVNEASGVTPEIREACAGRAMLLIISFNDNATLEATARKDAYTGILYKPLGIEHFARGLQGAVKWIQDPTNPELLGAITQLNKAAESRKRSSNGNGTASPLGAKEMQKMMQILGHRPHAPAPDKLPSPALSPSPNPAAGEAGAGAEATKMPPFLTVTPSGAPHDTPLSSPAGQCMAPTTPMHPMSCTAARFPRQNSLEPLRPSPTRTHSAPSTPMSLLNSSCEEASSTATTPPTTTSQIMEPPTPTTNSGGAVAPGASVSGFSTVSIADGGLMLSSCQRHGPTAALRTLRPPRIMVVEDNPINRRVLTALLKKRKFEYTEAVDGRAGVELFKSTPPNYWDAILMDITMPVMDGLEATRAIRHIETLRRASSAAAAGDAAESPLSSPASLGSLASPSLGSFTAPTSPIALFSPPAISTATAASPSASTAAAKACLGPPFDPCPSHHVKIFALTGLATVGDKRKAFASGVDGYLVKPVSLSTMDLLFKKIGF